MIVSIIIIIIIYVCVTLAFCVFRRVRVDVFGDVCVIRHFYSCNSASGESTSVFVLRCHDSRGVHMVSGLRVRLPSA